MLNSGKIFRASRNKKNKYSNSCVVRKKNSERNKKPQGLVTIQVNILSMYKHIQGRTSFLPPLASSRVCFLNSF